MLTPFRTSRSLPNRAGQPRIKTWLHSKKCGSDGIGASLAEELRDTLTISATAAVVAGGVVGGIPALASVVQSGVGLSSIAILGGAIGGALVAGLTQEAVSPILGTDRLERTGVIHGGLHLGAFGGFVGMAGLLFGAAPLTVGLGVFGTFVGLGLLGPNPTPGEMVPS